MFSSCEDETLVRLEAREHTDTLQQSGERKVDILWVVDNSSSMQAEQDKIAREAASFFSGLLSEQLDYHIGVVSTDRAEGGVLRAFSRSVTGCASCRFVSTAVPCTDPMAADAELDTSCPALAVFRELVRVGTNGSALEDGFFSVTAALGLSVAGDTGLPELDADGRPRVAQPGENAGFFRADADLMLIFVSDEDEGLESLGPPVRYYERLLSLVKTGGPRLLVASIVGWPFFDPADPLPPVAEVCDTLAPLYNGDKSDDAMVQERVRMALDQFIGCTGDDGSVARTGERYIDLSCRMGGLVGNICESSYTDTLGKLAEAAVRLGGEFRLSLANQLDRGDDCTLFTEDDTQLDCDDDGATDGPMDGPLCVTVVSEAGRNLIARGADGWEYRPTASAVVFSGTYEPPPGATVEVKYRVVPGRSECR